jgi:polysaccharide deacetylase 2 family uncharacterized protein YibQ
MDDQSRDETRNEGTGPDGFLAKLYRPGPLVLLFSLAFAGLLALGYFILTDNTPPQTMPAPVTTVEPMQPPRVYEEDTASIMEERVRQADLAIIEAMRAANLDMAGLDLLDVEMRTVDGRPYHYQVLGIPAVKDRAGFLKGLRARLGKRVPDAALAENGTTEVGIVIGGLPSHRLMLAPPPAPLPAPLPRPKADGPCLAIVIDDIGEDMRVLKGLLALDYPVTLAVWPNASQTRESVRLIVDSGRDLIVHFPMEPMGYPAYDPGDDAIFTTMSDDAIRQRVSANLALIPEAIGVNNHMGSKFTSHAPGMRAALTEFNRRGLFFLDSLTTARSVGRSTARQTGIPFYERDIFIDNVKDVAAITLQLRKAENVALKNGRAIAIGHPYPETLAALRAWAVQKNSAVRLLPLSRLAPQ